MKQLPYDILLHTSNGGIKMIKGTREGKEGAREDKKGARRGKKGAREDKKGAARRRPSIIT